MLHRRVVPGVQPVAARQQRLWHTQRPHIAATTRCNSAAVGVETGNRSQQADTAKHEAWQQQGGVRLVQGWDEIKQVAWLRAQAFYEEERSRFVESFKKKFAAGEADALEVRIAPQLPNGMPMTECLVATAPCSDEAGSEEGGSDHEDGSGDDEASRGHEEGSDDEVSIRSSSGTSTSGRGGGGSGSSHVLGCIDIRLPRRVSGKHPVGVPDDDATASYILNVVVDEERRGQGIGKMLMRAAMLRAVQKWESTRLYTHVAADNEVALKLYTGCGFKEHGVDAEAHDPGMTIGKLLLLCASADAVLEHS